MKIVLLGYMGSGKTTVGQQLAKKLYLNFKDLDHYIEKKEGKTISEIFKEKGEIYFRKAEHKYLQQFLKEKDSFVLSLGGGTPCYAGNMDIISNQEDLISFYLQASIPVLKNRLANNTSKRPLLSSLSDEKLTEYIGKHLFERSAFYEKATHRISIKSKDIDTIVAEIRIQLH